MTKVSTGFAFLEDDTTGNPAGFRRARDGKEFPLDIVAAQALVSGARNTEILTAANAGTDSGWLPINGPENLAWQLTSGSTSTNWQIDVSPSADGSSPTTAYTGTYASSTVIERSPELFNLPASLNARYFRFSVLSGGPISVFRNA